MKILIATVTIIAALISCGSKPVSSEPTKSDIIGEWECSELPDGFIREAGSKIANPISKIFIREDGSLSASNFPVRSPYRFVDMNCVWGLSDPSRTPSGTWSVEMQGHYLQCRRQGKELVLCLTISAQYYYFAEYKKKPNNPHMATPSNLND
jgi:hypothetical protein